MVRERLIGRSPLRESLYSNLTGSYRASAPFAGATAYGNSNNLSSNLNSRVIQMVITKNLTLAQAWGILDLARTNTTNAVTSFPFFATSEFPPRVRGRGELDCREHVRRERREPQHSTAARELLAAVLEHDRRVRGARDPARETVRRGHRLEPCPYAVAGIGGREGPG